ncbi:hypothetical protein Tco_0117799 [Tanacetum coccineum]
MSSSSSSINRNRVRSLPTHCKCGLPLARRISWTEWNPGRRFLGCRKPPFSGEQCSSFHWIDGHLNSQWYKTTMYELYVTQSPEQRDVFDDAINQFEMQITRQERLESLEQEFASYKSKMEADLKKYKSSMVQWKKLANSMVVIIAVLLGLFLFVI